MLGNNIAVIFWDGEPLNDISATQLHRAFAKLTNSKEIEIKVFEGNDIAALAVQAATQEAPKEDPVKNACIFMGTFFNKQLSMAIGLTTLLTEYAHWLPESLATKMW